MIPKIVYNITKILETKPFKIAMTFYTISVKIEGIEVRFYKYYYGEVKSFQIILRPWVMKQQWMTWKEVLNMELNLALEKFKRGPKHE